MMSDEGGERNEEEKIETSLAIVQPSMGAAIGSRRQGGKESDNPFGSPSSSSWWGEFAGNGIGGATMNFINSILGAGIIGLPYALRECGLGMGIFLLLLVALITHFTVCLLVKLSMETKGTHDFNPTDMFSFDVLYNYGCHVQSLSSLLFLSP